MNDVDKKNEWRRFLEERAEELRSRGQIKKQVVIYGYDGKL